MDLYSRIFQSIPDAVFVVDSNGTIRDANRQAHSLFDYAPSELVGRPIETLIPQRFSGGHSRHRDAYLSGPRLRPMGAGLELLAKRSDGIEFPVDVMLSPMDLEQDRVVLCVVRDVTTRQRDEQRLRDSLREKETLLKEIHHRVKNNLAVISSLLYLQSTRTADPDTAAVLDESQRRIRSMALVHETLYRSESLAAVEFAAYVEALCREVQSSSAAPGQALEVELELEPLTLPVDTAVPCALILNELLANAFKHAFPAGRSGKIHLVLRTRDSQWAELLVEDDGVGAPAQPSGQSLGLTLVHSLTRQIDGAVTTTSDSSGTRVCLSIPLQQAL